MWFCGVVNWGVGAVNCEEPVSQHNRQDVHSNAQCNYAMQNPIKLRRARVTTNAMRNAEGRSITVQCMVEKINSTTMTPDKCHLSIQIQRQKTFRKHRDCHEIHTARTSHETHNTLDGTDANNMTKTRDAASKPVRP